jgi:microsomal dipeptidase-like Zn-dependent dipeptidase
LSAKASGSNLKRFNRIAAFVLLGLVVAFFTLVPRLVDIGMNAVKPDPATPAPSAAAQALHRKLFIADLHCDSFLWNRDLLKRHTRGHVDVPRLIAGNVALETFTVVSQTPVSLNIERNAPTPDSLRLLMFAQLRPPATWNSPFRRALDQAARLRETAANSGGRLVFIRNKSELAGYVRSRSQNAGITAGWLGAEGAHALEGNLKNLDTLYDAGFRLIGLTHFFDNDFAGSAHGLEKYGLTEKGHELVRRMEAKKMIVDLAHSSPQTIADVLAMATRPVIVSHTGVKGVCNNRRNLSDDELRGVARTGGVIGIGFWETAVCGTGAAYIAKAVRYAVGVVGIEHVGLGSDFDGAVTTPFDATGLVELTDALLQQGFTEDEITKIMGGNVLRLLSDSLPGD